MPWNLLGHCEVVTPSIGMDKHSWGMRRLTKEDVLTGLDMTLPLPLDAPDIKLGKIIPGISWYVAAMMWSDATMDYGITESAPKRLKLNVFTPMAIGHRQQDLLNQISSQQQNQAAVKSNDTEVNVEIWLQHLLDGGVVF